MLGERQLSCQARGSYLVRRGRLVFRTKAVSKVAWGYALVLAEEGGELIGVGETEVISDGADTLVAMCEQFLNLCHAQLLLVLCGRDARIILEDASEPRVAYSNLLGSAANVQ